MYLILCSCRVYIFEFTSTHLKFLHVCIFNCIWMRREAFVQTLSCLSFQSSIGNCSRYHDTCSASCWECCPILVYSRLSSPEWYSDKWSHLPQGYTTWKSSHQMTCYICYNPEYLDSLRSPLGSHPLSEFMGFCNTDASTMSQLNLSL